MSLSRTIWVDRQIVYGRDSVTLHFDYDEQLIAICKMSSLRWHVDKRVWYLPNNPASRDVIKQAFEGKAQLDISAYLAKKSVPAEQKIPRRPEPVANHEEIALAVTRLRQHLEIQRYAASTVKTYSSLFETLLFHISKDPKDIDQDDLERYYYDVIIKKNYATSTHRQLIGALKHAKSLRILPGLAEIDLYLPRKDKLLPIVLNKEEVLSLLRAVDNLKHRTMIAVLYSCGLRIGELLSLQLAKIDFQRRTIHISQAKGRKDRVVVLSRKLTILLNNYIAKYRPAHYLIEGAGGAMYSATSVRKMLKRAAARAGIEKRVTPHTLRHSFATHLVDMQVNLRVVQKLLGHSSPETTAIYTHISNQMITEMVNPFDEIINLQEELNPRRLNNNNNNPQRPLAGGDDPLLGI